MPQPHIEDEVLDLYATGRLPQEQAPEIEEHLLLCGDCRLRLAQADEFALLFREAAVRPDARPARRWWHAWRKKALAGLAASAAAAAVLLITARREPVSIAPAVVSMQAFRGPETPPQIAANRPAVLVFDISAASGEAYEARIVDLAGSEVLQARGSITEGKVSVSIARLSRGSYWVRLYRELGGDPVAEYGLRVQ